MGLAQLNHHVAFLNHVPLTHRNSSHQATDLGKHRNLHFHRFHDHHGLPRLDGVTLAHQHREDVRDHLSADLLGHPTSLVGPIQPRGGHTAAMPQTQPSLRPATESDAPSIARLQRRSFEAALPWIPSLHTADEDLAFFATVTQDQSVLVCEQAQLIVGFTAWAKGWLNHLYVDPSSQRRGVGRALLTSVIEQHQQSATESTFQLWTFQRDFSARRFYEVHGLVPEEFTAGAHNEEHEPDIRYRWLGSTS